MAAVPVVVKNTFLEVAEHKFLYFDEPFGSHKRSQSCGSHRRSPQQWTPITPSSRSLSKMTLTDSSMQTSPRSDTSFFSGVESSGYLSKPTSPASSVRLPWESEVDAVTEKSAQGITSGNENSIDPLDWSETANPSTYFNCPTPTLWSPRELATDLHGQPCFCEESGFDGTEMDRVLCYLTTCEKATVDSLLADRMSRDGADPVCMERAAHRIDARTRLKSTACSFQPKQPMQFMPSNDARVDAVLNAVSLALASCGRIQNIKTNKAQTSPLTISAEVQPGMSAKSAYDIIHLAKQSIEAISERLPTITLSGPRIQKEENGYSLRSSMALLPVGLEDCMCWDMFRLGHCRRRHQCRWYHPQDRDTFRIKISIMYSEEVTMVSGQEHAQVETDPSPKKHKISLLIGDLV